MAFENLKKVDDRTYSFTLTDTHVSYANTLRRLILTGVETVAFRADMTSTGTTTDVVVRENTTPMTNEMLADRVGLLPIHVKEPLKWDPDRYVFQLKGKARKDGIVDVCAGDFVVVDRAPVTGGRRGRAGSNSENSSSNYTSSSGSSESNNSSSSNSSSGSSESSSNSSSSGSSSSSSGSNSASSGSTASTQDLSVLDEPTTVPTETFFPPHPVTRDTCLVATFPAGSDQKIDLTARATVGNGREHARFMPVSQCSYEYTRDTDEARRQELFEKWLLDAKKVVYDAAEADSEKIKALRREYETMEIARCYLRNENGEPYSFDFTVETVGVLDVPYIVRRACEVGEAMVGRYVNVEAGTLPEELTIGPADGRIIGFDFLFRGHDHTLGNLLQTWMVANLIDGSAEPKITFAGYKVPHPLRDEMVLRIGVADGNQATARLALAKACRGCVEIFRGLRASWEGVTGTAQQPARNLVRRAAAMAASLPSAAAQKPTENLLRRATAAAAAAASEK